jgi:hypothetical protein
MLRSLLIVATSLFVAFAANAQSTSVTTNCERNARATKETCTTVRPDSTITTTCVIRRGYWRWQSDKASCTTTTVATAANVTSAPVSPPKKSSDRDAFLDRYAALRRDFAYGDSLVKAATARGDSATARRLSADQTEMMSQIVAMSDTATKMKR